MLLRRDGFDCKSPQSSFGPGDFWARTPALPRGLSIDYDQRARVEPLADAVDALCALPRRAYRRSLDRSRRPVAARATRVRNRGGAPTPQRPHGADYSGGSRARQTSVGCWPMPISRALQPVRATIWSPRRAIAASTGLGIALFAYNIALWFGLRRRFQLAYWRHGRGTRSLRRDLDWGGVMDISVVSQHLSSRRDVRTARSHDRRRALVRAYFLRTADPTGRPPPRDRRAHRLAARVGHRVHRTGPMADGPAR